MLSEQAQDTIEKALYYARANVENYWHHWAGDKDEVDSLEKIDAALAEVRAAAQPQKPVPVEAIRKLICYGIPLGATSADWNQWRDSVAIWLDSRTKQVQP